jgi:polyferredoxin
MFGMMIYSVFAGAGLQQSVSLLWVVTLPWQWVEVDLVSPWVAQFAFGFYGVMLTSTVLGLVAMMMFKPRSWCVYCPMGTMTSAICKLKTGKGE